jgi:YD repeat-containing protein
MVAIVSGNSLGLSLTSLATLGQRGVAGSATQGRNGEAVYVNTATGNLVLQDRDDYLVSHGLSAAALRTYNSQGLLSDDNGDNWSTGVFAQQLQLNGTRNTAGSTLTRTDRDGAQAVYTYNADTGSYVSTEGVGAFDSITYDSANSVYVWSDGGSGLQERYESATTGRLLSSTDPSGNSLTYIYTGNLLTQVTDASGEQLCFDYSGNNLTQVRTVTAGNVTTIRTRYDYDTSNRLWHVTTDLTPEDNSVSDGKTYVTTYTYDGTSNRVETVSQTDGASLSFGYTQIDGSWKVTSVVDALGHATTFNYAGAVTRVTDALNAETRFTKDSEGRLLQIEAPAVAGVSLVNSFSYNTAGDLIQVIDGGQHAVDMAYDDHGNQTQQRDAAGNTVSRTFNARNQLATETVYLTPDADGAGPTLPSQPLTTRYVYDAADRNLLRFVLSPEGRVTEYRYNAYGERTTSIQYTGALYPVAGLGLSDGPTEAQAAMWVGAQDLSLCTRTDMGYDYRGQLRTTTTYTSVDANGTGVADATSSVTQYVYDQTGQLLSTFSPAGGSTIFTYDGFGRVLTSTDALNHITVTLYDDANNRTEVTLVNGLTTTSTYDAGGRLVSVLQSTSTTANLGETRYFYDANNRLVMTQDPTGVRQWMLYDDAGRKVADIDGDGSLTEYSYNTNNQLTRTVAYAEAVNVAIMIDGAGNPTLPSLGDIRPAAGPFAEQNIKTWQAYDAAGRLVKTVNPAGSVTILSYDRASRLIKQRRLPDALTLEQREALGASPEASAIAPAEWFNWERRTHNYYSADGLLIGHLDEENYYTQNAYDAAGRLISTTRYANQMEGGLIADDYVAPVVIQNGDPIPSSTHVRISHDTSPNPTGADQVTRFFYNSKGQLAAQVDAENYLTDHVYDTNGNLATIIRYAEPLTVTLTAATRLADLPRAADPQNQVTTSVYDDLNRVRFQTNVEGTVTEYQYDNVGNLVSTTAAYGQSEARTLNARFDVQGRLVAQLSGEGSARLDGNQTQAEIEALWDQYAVTHTYDTSGRRASTTDQSGYTTVFYYDVDGRLTHTINALGEIAEAHYNALGQLDLSVRYGTRISPTGLTGGLATTAIVDAISALRNDAVDSTTQNFYDGGVNRLRYVFESISHPLYTTISSLTAFTYTAYGELEAKVLNAKEMPVRHERFEYDRRGLTTEIRNTDHQDLPGSPTTTFSYDAFGRLYGTDSNGHQSHQYYDRLGRVIQTIDAGGANRSSTYDAFSRIRTQTNALGQLTEYWYNRTDRSQTVRTPEGIKFITTHTRHGQTDRVITGRRAGPEEDQTPYTTFYEYDHDGNLTGTSKGQITTSQVFDSANRVETTRDANGNEVHYSYDAANRVLSVTVDPTGLQLTTSYRYDAKGQAVWTQDPNGVWTQTQYNLRGEVTAVTVDPIRGPDWLEGQADDNAAGLALTTTYTYDGVGNQVDVTDPAGTLTLYSYDILGRRVTEQLDPNGLNITRHYTYDVHNNVVASTDDNQDVTRYAYDSNNRLTFTIDGAGGISRNEYDDEGRLTRSTHYVEAIPPATLAGLPLQVSSDDIQQYIVTTPGRDAIQANRYDRDNRLRFTVDGTGAVTEFRYDADGNVTERIGYANPINLAGWDGSTDPAVVAAPNFDQRIRTTYDALNRATYVADASGSVTHYVYDGNGNISSQTRYASTVTGSTEPENVVPNPADRVSIFSYDAANRLTWQVDAAGSVTHSIYDGNGNIVYRIAYAKQINPGTEPGNMERSIDDRINRMVYDQAGRAIFNVDALGYVTRNTYDAVGQVIRTSQYDQPVSLTADILSADAVAGAVGDWQQTFSVDASGLSPDITAPDQLQNGELSIFSMATAENGWRFYKGLASGPQSKQVGTTISGEIRPTGDGRRAFHFGAEGSDQRFALGLDANTVYLQTVDFADPSKNLSFAIGSFDLNKTYIAEINTDAQDTVLRLYEKGRPPSSGIVYHAGAARGTFQVLMAASRLADEPATVVTYIDNLEVRAPGRTTSNTYDAAGRLDSSTDALGHTESYAYDGPGNKLRFTNKKGSVWTYTYDAAGRLETETSPAVSLTTLGEVAGNLTAGSAVDGAIVTHFDYDGLGNLSSRTEAYGRVNEQRTTSYVYDAMGRQVRVIYPAVSVYSEGAAALAANGATGLAERVETLHSQATNNALFSQTFYDALGNAVINIDVAGNVSHKIYDTMGRVIYAVDAMGYFTSYDLNAFGEVETLTRHAETMSLSGNTPTSAANRLTVVDGHYAAMTSNPETRRTLTSEYDHLGRVTQVTESATYTYDSTPGAHAYGIAGKVTRSTYNAFGDLVQQAVSKNSEDDTWALTASYYDLMGRNVAEVNAEGYLTTRGYDAVGNLTAETEYAERIAVPTQGSWQLLHGTPESSALNRTTEHAYDKGNRKTQDIRKNVAYHTGTTTSVGGVILPQVAEHQLDVITSYGYDAVGNLTRTTNESNGASTFSYYDALGRVTAVAAPTRSSTVDGTALTPITQFLRDAHGNVLVKIERALGSMAAIEYTGVSSASQPVYPTLVSDAQDRHTYSKYDSHGRLVQSTDATGHSKYNSYNERGELAKTWEGVTSGTSSSMPGATGPLVIDSTIFTAYQYDKLGRLTHTLSMAPTERLSTSSVRGSSVIIEQLPQGSADLIDTVAAYNAFGEIVSKGVFDGGAPQEYFKYDNAGRMWATNAGDGVDKIMLYDLQGRTTSVISSSGGPGSIGLATQSAQVVAGASNTRRTDYVYDAFGHVTQERAPWRMTSQDGVSIRSLSTGYSIASSSVMRSEEIGVAGNGDDEHPIYGMRWDRESQNVVNISWSDLSKLGTGDVRVTLGYMSQSYEADGVEHPSVPLTYTWVFTTAAGIGATLRWSDLPEAVNGGISAITSVVVDKKNAQGVWVAGVNNPGSNYSGSVIEVATPQDGVAGTVALKIHRQGTPDTLANWTTVGENFGDAWRFDLSALPDAYDYKVVRIPLDGSPEETLRTGAFAGGTVLGDQTVEPWQRPITTQTVDRWGNVLSRSDARNADWVTAYSYNANNQVTTQTQPVADLEQGSSVTTYYYDAQGQQIGVRDANLNLNLQSYDAVGNLQSEHHADGGQVTYGYNAFGNKVVMRDAIAVTPDPNVDAATRAKHVTRYTYDGLDRLLTTAHGQVDIYTSRRSHEDGGGGVILTSQGSQNVVETNVYDQAGRKISQTNGANQTTRYRYDLAGHVVESADPLDNEVGNAGLFRTRTLYDRFGHKTAEADAENYFSTWSYDYFGKIRQHTDLGGSLTWYTYDNGLTGQLTGQYSDRGQSITYTYDAAGQQTGIHDGALNQDTSYVYDLAGNHVRETTRQAGYYNIYQDSHLAYDALGRLRDVSDGRMHIGMSYDAVGNRMRITTHVNVMEPNSNQADTAKSEDRFFAYDSMNRQRIVDGVRVSDGQGGYLKDARGNYRANITLTQGRELSYDVNGNRASEIKGGKHITVTGSVVPGFYAYRESSDGGRTYLTDDNGERVVFSAADIGHDNNGRPYIIPAPYGTNNVDDSGEPVRFFVDGVVAGPAYSDTTSYTAADDMVTDTYTYDAMDRLTTIAHDGVAVNFNYYDAASRLLQSGLGRGTGASQDYVALMNAASSTPGSVPGAGLADETTQNVYDANGRLKHQIIRNPSSGNWGDRARYLDNVYDRVGNVTYTNYEVVKQYFIDYHYYYAKFDTYKLDHATGAASNGSSGSSLLGGALGGVVSSALGLPGLGEYLGHTGRIFNGLGGFEGGSGTTQNSHDANGFLTATSYSEAPTRRYVNTAQGQMLYSNTDGDASLNTGTVLRTVIANGENMGSYGVSGSKQVADFNFSFQALTGQQGGVSRYVVQAGDTLRSIALRVYGDETLWYRIADSNGLAGDTDLRPGQTLNLSSQVGTIHNNADTFKHFDQRQIAGDSTPTLGPPGEACGGNGQMIVTVVAVVVTVVVAYFTAGTGLTAANAMWAALGAAGGNLAGQVVANELGMQDGINWKSVAVSAVGGAMTAGLGGGGFEFTGGVVVRAAVANATTQAISVMVGWQERFDWRGVAASAVGAAVGQAVGGALGINDPGFKSLGFGEQFGARLMTGLATGTASTVMRGGKVAIEQVVVDAFGNALGESLASQSDPRGQVYNDGDVARSELRVRSAGQTDPSTLNAFVDAFGGAQGWANGRDTGNDVLLAAGEGFSLGSGNDSDRFRAENLARMQRMLDETPTDTSAPPYRVEINGVGSTSIDDYNAQKVWLANKRGEDLRPTLANAARLDLVDPNALSDGQRSGMVIAAALAGGDAILSNMSPEYATGFNGPAGVLARPMAEAIVDYKLGERSMGLTQAVLGGYAVAGTLGTGTWFATPLALDQMYAGARTLVTGDLQNTFLNQGLQDYAGLTPRDAALAEAGINVAALAPAAISVNRALNAELQANAAARATYQPTLGNVRGTADVVGLDLSVRPTGVAFDGTVYRLESPSRVGTTFDIHAGNIASDHRYSAPGVGSVYGATSAETAFAEVDHYGFAAGRVSVNQNVSLGNVLDLTNPTVRGQLNVTLEQITGDSYKVTHQLGDFARANSYDGLLAPSARNIGGSNLVIFPKVPK